jgi:hypothetical protein
VLQSIQGLWGCLEKQLKKDSIVPYHNYFYFAHNIFIQSKKKSIYIISAINSSAFLCFLEYRRKSNLHKHRNTLYLKLNARVISLHYFKIRNLYLPGVDNYEWLEGCLLHPVPLLD